MSSAKISWLAVVFGFVCAALTFAAAGCDDEGNINPGNFTLDASLGTSGSTTPGTTSGAPASDSGGPITTTDSGTSGTSGTSGFIFDAGADVVIPQYQFLVGGTVTGLGSNTGLALKLNAGAPLAIGGDGPFLFATQITVGASYSVTISAQPTGTTCSVSGGTGTMGLANVNTVVINCAPNTYTVGGTVFGLAIGASVALANGSDTTTVTSNGSFAFPTTVGTGTAYAVSVTTQPSSPVQTCTVSGGSGSVVSANVTNVSVTCTTGTFKVGGTVTGIATGATPLVLQNNGGDNVSVAADGTFSFLTAVASGGSYAVTVLSNPSTPSETCTVASGAGSITTADVTNVAVTCGVSAGKIGGQLTGLVTGNTIVLENNGGDDLTLSADGSFQFATSEQSGNGYNVSILTQPTGQNCVVNGNAGVVGAGDVQSVVVNCQPNGYTVGGQVSGINGGVKLSNGKTTVIVNANASYAFSTIYTTNQPYAVGIADQPHFQASGPTPEQTCTVANATGTVVTADISDVNVACTTNQYSLSGTVDGLAAGESVTVTNAGVNIPVSSATPSFTFPNLNSASSWNVTVTTQPGSPTTVTQTCVVDASATGVVPGQNVSGVHVQCTTNKYQVTGTITNLNASGRVLKLRNTYTLESGGQTTQDVSVSGTSTTFQFSANQVQSGQTYTISKIQDPLGLSQTCVVDQNAGPIVVRNANVSNVHVTCTTNTFPVKVTLVGYDNGGQNSISITNTVDTVGETWSPVLTGTPVADTTHTFTTQVASGDTYTVTTTQPGNPAQTCTVIPSGAQAIGDGPEGDVIVNCGINSFILKGTITGLATGAKVVVHNVGNSSNPSGEDVTVTGTGTGTDVATFTHPVPSGEGYAITVTTSPSDATGATASQTCLPIIPTNSGTMGNPGNPPGFFNPGNVVNCTTHLHAISVTVSGYATGPKIPIDAGGNPNLLVAELDAPTAVLFNSTSGTTQAFPGPVSGQFLSGSSYDVSVIQNPTNPQQTCTPVSPTGQVADSDIVVTVNCVRTTASINVVVNGLANGNTVALHEATGNDDLSIIMGSSALATVSSSFATQVANGSTYSVTIKTQPSVATATHQQCKVRNDGKASGTIATGTPVSPTVTIDCGTTCATLKQAFPTTVNGDQTVDLDGQGGNAPFANYCDMTFNGGGWTAIMVTRAVAGPIIESLNPFAEVSAQVAPFDVDGPNQTSLNTFPSVAHPNGVVASDNTCSFVGFQACGTQTWTSEQLPLGYVLPLARLSAQVWIRGFIAGAGSATVGTNWLLSNADQTPIKNLVAGNLLNFNIGTGNASEAFWTSQNVPLSVLDFPTFPTASGYPNLYQSTGNGAGFNIEGDVSAFSNNDVSGFGEAELQILVK